MEQNDTKVFKVINGNSYELLKDFPDNYFDAIVTDPPYGLGKEPDANETLKAWIETGYIEVKGSGFMGKEWDAFVPQPIFWKEVFRVLKHGGHVLAFYGTRTYDWGVMSMRLAGFEVRDCIQWIYGSGFPKSHNISKAIDKMYGAERQVVGKSNYSMPKADNSMRENSYGISGGKLANGNTAERVVADITAPTTNEAKEWDGWGSALKPANEPIVLARKPLEKGLSIAENVLKWGTGAINIDGCRIGYTDNVNMDAKQKTNNLSKVKFFDDKRDDFENPIETYKQGGRFPANLILTHHEDCVCKGTKKVKAIKGGNSRAIQKNTYNDFGKNYDNTPNGIGCGFGDENGNEEVEDWNCHEDCPIRILDEQSGESKSSDTKRNRNTIGSFGMPNDNTPEYNDKGGASRFFYVAKASKSERNKGLDEFEEKPLAFSNQAKAELKRGNKDFDGGDSKGHGNSIRHIKNFHPTVKPIKLMQYLVRLITPPNGIVLDPFCGSGTTGIACKLEGFEFVGIEQDAEYCKIADARIKNYTEEKQYSVKIKIDDTQLDLF